MRYADRPNAFGCYDLQCLDSTWDHECPVVPVTVAGTVLTDEVEAELVAEAEAGYDPAHLVPRRQPKQPSG
jgi:hypothetical protein